MTSTFHPRSFSILETEVSTLTMAMKRGHLWNRSGTDSLHPALLQPFLDLKRILSSSPSSSGSLSTLDPNAFLAPFLDVIRSEVVTGPITGLALGSVNKFLCYGLLHPDQANIANAVESLADAVTHARFVGVDPSADEVVLMKIMEVLRTLMLSPVGLLLTNESVCEIMQSTFRICFENRLSELLRKTAEHTLSDMIQLLFTRLPHFTEESLPLLKKLKMRSIHGDKEKSRRKAAGGSAPGGGKSKQAKPKTLQTSQSAGNMNGSSGKEASSSSAATIPSSPTATTGSPVSPSENDSSNAATGADEENEASKPMLTSQNSVESTNQPESLPPTSPVSTQFNVDSDVLARSPIGSVTDLSAVVQNEPDGAAPSAAPEGPESLSTEDQSPKGAPEAKVDEEGVGITVTSPHGTERQPKEGEEVVVASSVEAAPETAGEEQEEPIPEESSAGPSETISTEFTNSQGVTFTPTTDMVDESGALIPYGLPCVRELFRFLVSLINPHDSHNQDMMVQIALSLLATALETGAEHLDKFESLLALVKDDLARNLVSLLSSERIGTFSSALWISYMMFESQRKHLKYQTEIFLNRLIEVVCSEQQKITYEHKELALEIVVRFYRIPGFLTQLYLNFDCDMYTSNIFEDLTKMLSKNAFPVTGLYSTHFLSLDALLTVIESIEAQCQRRMISNKEDIKNTDDRKENEDSDSRKENPVDIDTRMVRCSGRHFGLEVAKSDGTTSETQSNKDDGEVPIKIPTHEEVMALKHKKKLITTATEQFNAKPSKGITYMQECKLMATPPDAAEIVRFVRQNPHLDKNQLGEYISNRKNLEILEAYVKSFDFHGLRIDESLRMFLEAFRLPGEAPVISLIVEHFADHWQRINDDPLQDADAAFTLAYAVIMLNVDQHNKNATKNNDPMTLEEFTRNLRGTNGGQNHDPDMLSEIYHAIKTEEIVMPAEQTGLVKENYLWKCVLKRGAESSSSESSSSSDFIMAPNGYFDHDLFSIIWGPTVAALSYVFDKSQDGAMIERALHGFQRCAMIAAHYHMSDVFDNLVISLCKFTTLLTVSDSPDQFIPIFGMNSKAMLATRMVFSLVQKHGDILRDGWKNVSECLLQLFKCQLLGKSMMEAECYVESAGRVKLFREEIQAAKVEQGFLNSFVSFISMSSETATKSRTPEEEEFAKVAAKCIKDCNLESIVTESKFLLADSLQDLVKFLISGSHLDDVEDEHARLFYLELLVRITIQNRDRVQIIWRPVADHLARLIISSSSSEKTSSSAGSGASPASLADRRHFMLERSVTALLRLAVRLSRKEDLASTVVQSLQLLLALKVNVIFHVCQHIAFGLYELLRNNAANIHETSDWAIIFSLIEVVGAGANPETSANGAGGEGGARGPTDEDSGHGASSESEATNSRNTSPSRRERSESFSSGGWIVLGANGDGSPVKSMAVGAASSVKVSQPLTSSNVISFNQFSIVHHRPLVMHDSKSFLRCCESLAFLIRDVAHITPHNYFLCVQALRTFVEASVLARQDETLPTKRGSAKGERGAIPRTHLKRTPPGRAPPTRRARSAPHHSNNQGSGNSGVNNGENYDADESDSNGEDLSTEYHHVALQLLDLMHTLHTRAGQIHKAWAEEGTAPQQPSASSDEPVFDPAGLWAVAWCPLLQGMSRLCCDKRSHIRTTALTTLQRALLFHDLQSLASNEWESAFTEVLFPLLSQLLIKSNPGEKTAMEETRTRAATLLGKVFLQHLTPLTGLGTFTALWLTILDFMDRFIKTATSDLLADAVPESLKNLLLVMDTQGIFFGPDGQSTKVWALTWEKLETFLPNLMRDLFGKKDRTQSLSHQQQVVAPNPAAPSQAAAEPNNPGENLPPQETHGAPIPQQEAAVTQVAADQSNSVLVAPNSVEMENQDPPAGIKAPPVLTSLLIQPPAVVSSDAVTSVQIGSVQEESEKPPPTPTEPPVLGSSAFATSPEPAPGPGTSVIASGPEEAAPGSNPAIPMFNPADSAPSPFAMAPPPPLPSTSSILTSKIPALPEIAPLPPPPITIPPLPTGQVNPASFNPSLAPAGFAQNQQQLPPQPQGPPQPQHQQPIGFHPIQAAQASTSASSVPLANPIPMPHSYFPPSPPGGIIGNTTGPAMAGNILTAGFTPTLPTTATPVFLQQQPPSKSE